MKNKKQYVLSFFIPIIIFFMVCCTTNIIFWGTKNFLISDSKAQYVSLFSYLREVLLGNESLFYSFSKGMGGNMLGTYAYYLASPLNLLIIFFSKKTLVNGMLLIISLKIGLSGLTMFSYLKKKHKKKVTLYLFSSSYALMGYIVVYFFNIMWLDAIYLAPLLLMSIDKIIDGKKSLMYGIVLFVSIFSNYYIGYMLCVLSCLYFVYNLLLKFNYKEDKEKIISSIIKFSIASLLAGLMTAFLLIPTVYELAINVGRVGEFRPHDQLIKGDPLILFSRFFVGSHNRLNLLNVLTPALYTGIIILPLVYFYFVNKEINKKEKIITGLLLTFLFSGFFVNYINFFWHGFSHTNSFSFRYSFIISMFLILIACKSFYKIKHIDLKHYLLFLIGYLVLSNAVVFQRYDFLNTWFIFLSVGLLILYMLMLYCYYKVSDKDKKTLKLLLIILVLSELLVNFYFSIYKYELDYKAEYNETIDVIGEKVKDILPAENDFYRIEKNLKYTMLDSMLLNYSGVSTFLSTISNDSQQIINNIGHLTIPSKINYNLDGSLVTDSLLGIKYFITPDKHASYKLNDTFSFSKFSGLLFNAQVRDVYIYENPNALSLGYMVNDKVYDFIDIFAEGQITNVFEVQNYILKTMLNSNDSYLKPYHVSKNDDNRFTVDINNDNDIYMNIPVAIPTDSLEVYVYVDDSLVHTYKYGVGGIFKLDNKYENQKVELKFETNEGNDKKSTYIPSVYYLDEELFLEAVSELKKNQLDIDIQKKNYIKGKVKVTEDKQVLFTTIPYEKGWSILVDGKKVDYHSIFDAFIGLDLSVGEHEVEFKFVPPLFKLGLVISLISAILFGIYMKFENKIIKFIIGIYFGCEEIINYLIAGGLTTVVSIGSYGIFTKLLNINYIISTILSFVLAVTFAYLVNKIFVFKTEFKNKEMVLHETYQFFKYRILSLLIDVMLMILFVEMLHINDLIAKIIVQVVIVIANYFFSKIFIFKKQVN